MQRLTTLILGLLFAMATIPAHAADPAIHIAVGQTVHLALDKDDKQDYAISLSKGAYDIVMDIKRSDDESHNIQAQVQLLKTNGVIVDSSFLSSNEMGVSARVGRQFIIPKPLAARLRVSHDAEIPLDIWLTVLPAKKMKLLPFGFGNAVSPAKIGNEAGVGGDIEKNASAYYSITLPPGKWSVSLGLKLPKGEDTNLQGQIDLLSPYGFPVHNQLVTVNEIGNEARADAIIVATKPKPILLRVTNTNGGKTYHYDLTIDKSTD